MGTDVEVAICNRAAVENGRPAARPRDSALAAVLTFHGVVMSGGLDHAFDVLDSSVIDAAVAGYRYLGAGDVADLVQSAKMIDADDDDALEGVNRRYDELVPTDAVLGDLTAARIRRTPADFAPV